MADKAKKILSFDLSSNRNKLARQNILINNKSNITIFKNKVNGLDEIFRLYKIKTCSLLKIDCEGSEYKIFNNCSVKTLRKIKRITIETHLFNNKMKEQYKYLKAFLVKNKFNILEKANPVHSYLKFLYAWK